MLWARATLGQDVCHPEEYAELMQPLHSVLGAMQFNPRRARQANYNNSNLNLILLRIVL